MTTQASFKVQEMTTPIQCKMRNNQRSISFLIRELDRELSKTPDSKMYSERLLKVSDQMKELQEMIMRDPTEMVVKQQKTILDLLVPIARDAGVKCSLTGLSE